MPITDALISIPRDFFFGHTFPASWFFGALLVGVPLICLLTKTVGDNFAWLLSLSFYICMILDSKTVAVGENFDSIYQSLFHSSMSLSWPRGIMPLTIGYYLSNESVLEFVKKINTLPAIVITIIILILLSMHIVTYGIGVILLPSSMFVIAYNMKVNIDPALSKRLRAYSVLYYCTHYSIIHVFWKLGVAEVNEGGVILFMCTFITVTFVATLVYRLKDIKHLKWLKYSM